MGTPTGPISTRAVLGAGARIVIRFIRRRPVPFALAASGAALFAAAIIAASRVIGWVTDNAIIPVLRDGEPIENKVLVVVLAILGVSTWKAAGIVLRRTAAGWFQLKTQQDVREQLVEHQLGLELSWYGRQSVGNLISVADADASQGTNVLSPLPYATGVSLLIIGTVVLLTILDVWLGLTAFIGMSVIVSVEARAAVTLFPSWEGIQTQMGVVSGVAHESFDGALTVKALGREATETARLEGASDNLRDQLIELNVRWETYRVLIVSLIPVVALAVIAVGAIRVDSGAITPGDVITGVYLLSLLSFPIQLIAFVLFDMAAAIPAWTRVTAILGVDEVVQYGEQQADLESGAAPVEGNEVSFGYEEEIVLADVDIDIPAGMTVAIVGPTGSGKTTLTLLLARLWDPGTGRIHIDGRDLRSFARFELPREIAFVSQSSFLFDDTVAGNIALGGDFSTSEIEAAAALAGARDFVEELPETFDTPIGERGATLSGGQRQRLTLARALVRKPRVLIMDDATSAVDPSVEAEILRGLRSAELPSTILIVAYRPSSIRLADEVVFVEAGRVVDQGTHTELMQRRPGYARLVHAYEEDAAVRAEERA